MKTTTQRAGIGRQRPGHAAGFTLIEVMIVVAVLGILAAIAYPNYRDRMIESRRADAKIMIMEAIQAARRYKSENGTFNGFLVGTHVPAQSAKGYYGLSSSYTAASATSDENLAFVARPVTGGSQWDDPLCIPFVLATNGDTFSDRRNSTPAGCWDD